MKMLGTRREPLCVEDDVEEYKFTHIFRYSILLTSIPDQ